MTRIDFYTQVDNKLRFAGKLCAKALAQKLRVNVYAPDHALAERFDRLLWTDNAVGFIPHCRADAPLAPETPVLIHTQEGALQHDDLLINLDPAWPPFFSRFERVIEIVGTDPEDAAAARERFRFYRDRGYALQTHDMGAQHE
jgi:DNA polymerase-3 subunit chi